MIASNENAPYHGPVKWVFELIKKAYGIDVMGDQHFSIKLGFDDDDQINLSKPFYDKIFFHKAYGFRNHFDNDPLIYTDQGQPDYISTIFYLVNGIQEYSVSEDDLDQYGRMQYEKSLQYHYDILEIDLVKHYIQKLLFQISDSFRLPKQKSRIFISHDIDSVFGSLKYDGLWALKNARILDMLKVILQSILYKPEWFNIDKVAKLENEYDVKACYYWIVQNGRSRDGIKNGDYQFSSKKIQDQLKIAQSYGNELGLHKSTMSSSIEQELAEIPSATSNRYHFLKIDNPDGFETMEHCNLQSDSSIGFAYHMGFKNNFGMPYYPYDIKRNKKCNVLEIPLQIMDGMFDMQGKQQMILAYDNIVDFIEKNNTDAIISILWHNSEMTNYAYKWSFQCYKKLLQYFADQSFDFVLPSQLVNEYEMK